MVRPLIVSHAMEGQRFIKKDNIMLTEKLLRQALSAEVKFGKEDILLEVLSYFPEVIRKDVRERQNTALYYAILEALRSNTAAAYTVIEEYVRLKTYEELLTLSGLTYEELKELLDNHLNKEQQDYTLKEYPLMPMSAPEVYTQPEEEAVPCNGNCDTCVMCASEIKHVHKNICSDCASHMKLGDRPFTCAQLQVYPDGSVTMFEVEFK